jgi:AcrR family transcriptional regulator
MNSAAEADRPHRGNRWGRSEQAREAVLEAADDLLAERGFAGVTIEGIATAAGVAKQTIYRWWTSKTDILMDALAQDAAALTPADHGDLREDLYDQLSQLADFLTGSDAGAVCRALVGQALHDPGFAAVFRARFLAEQRERDRLPLDRAIARGELPPDTDVLSDIDELHGPIYYRVLVTGAPVGRPFTDRLVDHYLQRVGLRGKCSGFWYRSGSGAGAA